MTKFDSKKYEQELKKKDTESLKQIKNDLEKKAEKPYLGFWKKFGNLTLTLLASIGIGATATVGIIGGATVSIFNDTKKV